MLTVTPKLKNITPHTGRVIDEADTVHNVVDPYGGFKVVDVYIATVHEGKHWTYSEIATLTTGQSIYLFGRVGALPAHLTDFSIKSDSAPITVEMFEAPTISALGTPATVINRNRDVAVPPLMQVYVAPTVTDDGTRLFVDRILGTQQTVSSLENRGEWLLKPATDYLFKIINNSNQSAAIRAAFDWVEDQA